MILLNNDCAYSGLSVSPKNWNGKRVSMKKKWYIHYRFYAPDCPEGKLKIIKSGINQINDLALSATYLQNPEKFRQYSKDVDAPLIFSPYEQGDFDQLYWANQLQFKEKPLPDDFYKFGI